MSDMSHADFKLTYDGPALRGNQMNVRDLAPAMLAVGELFEALNSLYNGKQTEVAVNVRALSAGCFNVDFDVVQAIRDGMTFLAGTEVTAAMNLKAILFDASALGYGLFRLIRFLKGRTPERIEKLSPGLFRLTIDDKTIEVPMALLQAYQDLTVRRAVERIVSKPLARDGIDEVRLENEGQVVERITKEEAPIFRAPALADDVIVDDTRKAAYTIRDLSFDEDGLWRLNDGSNPIKASIEDRRFLDRVDNNDIRFAKHDVLLCLVHFVQKRTARGVVVNEYTVKEVLEHIPAPRQLRFPEAQDYEDGTPLPEIES